MAVPTCHGASQLVQFTHSTLGTAGTTIRRPDRYMRSTCIFQVPCFAQVAYKPRACLRGCFHLLKSRAAAQVHHEFLSPQCSFFLRLLRFIWALQCIVVATASLLPARGWKYQVQVAITNQVQYLHFRRLSSQSCTSAVSDVSPGARSNSVS